MRLPDPLQLPDSIEEMTSYKMLECACKEIFCVLLLQPSILYLHQLNKSHDQIHKPIS